MTTATCTECGAMFWRDDFEKWKVRCLSCWKATKKPRTDPDASLRWYREGIRAGREAALSEYRDGCATIDATRLRQLIRLCHPDLHNGSDLAQRTTAWLLDLRKRVTA